MKPVNSRLARAGLLEIAEDLVDMANLQAFINNINHLFPDKEMSLFEWWETYLAWSEVGTEEDMERYYDTE